MAYILLWNSAVRVHDSQAYRKMDVTRKHITCILELREILLVFAAVVCAILESISGLEPSSVIRYFSYKVLEACDSLKLLSVQSSQEKICCILI